MSAFAILPAAVSVKLHPSGWAWLVCRNRALLWRYAPVQSSVWVSTCTQLLVAPSSHARLLFPLPAPRLAATSWASHPQAVPVHGMQTWSLSVDSHLAHGQLTDWLTVCVQQQQQGVLAWTVILCMRQCVKEAEQKETRHFNIGSEKQMKVLLHITYACMTVRVHIFRL